MPKSSVLLVKEFHELFDHPIGKFPVLPSKGNMEFRRDFIAEESKETMTAYDNNDIVELADGLGDIQYVLDGWFLNAGLHIVKDEILAEIHRSNLSKVCQNYQEAEATKLHCENTFKDDTFRISLLPTGHHAVFRESDNKVQKSINYSKPDIKSIIELAHDEAYLDSVHEAGDPINPKHYTDGKIQVIEYIEDKGLGFNLGNAVKYISRAGKKNPDKEKEDLLKAQWYINRQLERLK